LLHVSFKDHSEDASQSLNNRLSTQPSVSLAPQQAPTKK